MGGRGAEVRLPRDLRPKKGITVEVDSKGMLYDVCDERIEKHRALRQAWASGKYRTKSWPKQDSSSWEGKTVQDKTGLSYAVWHSYFMNRIGRQEAFDGCRVRMPPRKKTEPRERGREVSC